MTDRAVSGTLSTEPVNSHSRASRARIISNALYSAASYLLVIPVTLLLSSFVVHRIGIAPFGIWATLMTIVGYGSLLDLGVTTPLVKYVAEYIALDRRHEVNVLLSTAMVLYAAVGMAFLGVMTLASDWILLHFFHAGSSYGTVRQLYFAVVVGFAVSLTFSVLQSLIVGLQRVDIIARIGVAFTLLGAALTVVALNLGLGVSGLAVSWLVTMVLNLARNWLVAKRLFPSLVLNPLLFRWTYLKKILGFSSKVQVTTLTLVLNDQVDRALIAYVLGPAMLGYYALASRAATALRNLSFALMRGLLPAASDLAAVNQTERLRQLYLRASRYLAIIDFGMCLGVAVLAGALVDAWLGPGYGRVAATLVIILVGYAVWLPDEATTEVLNGTGRPEIRMRADLLFLGMHIPLSLLLIWRFGYFGTVVGTSFALAVTRIYLYVTGARALEVPVSELVRFSFLQPAAGVILASASAVIPQLAGAPPSVLAFLAEGTLFAAVYATYIAIFALDSYDRQLLRSFVTPLVRRMV